ncbi:MAG: putative C-S lyase [Bacteroidales bacterium]|nr:putative C-S lyase [Bacteroidales bacterium]
MKKYNFDRIIPRTGTNSVKYDGVLHTFGSEDVIPLWVADMDFRCPEPVVEALRQRVEHGIYGYTFVPDGYYEALAGWMEKRHRWSVRREWVVFSPGVVAALHLAVNAFTRPGDGVIVQPPVYFPFFSAVKENGRRLVYNELKLENSRYTINWDDLREKASRGARMLLFCHPHNPAGRCWTAGELETLADICREYDLILLSDEIHADLTLPGYRHLPMAALNEEIAGRTITCVSASKTFNLAGLATSAVIISNSELREKFESFCRKVHTGSGNLFGYTAAEAAYRYGEEWLNEVLEYLSENIQFAQNFFRKHIPVIEPIPTEATYLMWLDCRKLGLSPEQLGDFMVKQAGIGLNNGAMFGPGGEGFMRLNVACPRALLERALERLRRAIDHDFSIR